MSEVGADVIWRCCDGDLFEAWEEFALLARYENKDEMRLEIIKTGVRS